MRKINRRALLMLGIIPVVLILTPIVEKLRGMLALRAWKTHAVVRKLALTAGDIPTARQQKPAAYQPSQEVLEAELAWTSAFKHPPTVMMPCGPAKALPTWKAPVWRDAYLQLQSWDQFTQMVNACDDKVAQLREDIANRRVTPVLDAARGSVSQLPGLGLIETMLSSLTSHTLVALRRGDLATAHADLLAMAALSAATGEAKSTASQFVRFAMEFSVRGTLWEALQAKGWSDTQLAGLQDAFAQPHFVSRLADALEAERAATLERQMHSQPSIVELQDALGVNGVPGFLNDPPPPQTVLRIAWGAFYKTIAAATRGYRERAFLVFWRFAWREQDCVHGQKAAAERVDALRAAVRESNWIATRGGHIKQHGQAQPVGTYDHMRFWFSMAENGFRKDTLDELAAEAEVTRQLAVTAIALERYRLKHEELPANLQGLAPEFLPAPPLDFMDGKPLRYQPQANGAFLLYSVGKDGGDNSRDLRTKDGGIAMLDPEMYGDIAWPMPATPQEYDAYETRRFGRR